jgi:hypothetical protein
MHALSEVQQEVMARLTKILEKLSTQGGTRHEEGETSHGKRHEDEGENSRVETREQTQPFTNRLIKLEFPRFNGGKDPTGWICRAEQFFRFQGTSEEEKTPLASFHLEGEAQLWYQILLREDREIRWVEFTDALCARFGPN